MRVQTQRRSTCRVASSESRVKLNRSLLRACRILHGPACSSSRTIDRMLRLSENFAGLATAPSCVPLVAGTATLPV